MFPSDLIVGSQHIAYAWSARLAARRGTAPPRGSSRVNHLVRHYGRDDASWRGGGAPHTPAGLAGDAEAEGGEAPGGG